MTITSKIAILSYNDTRARGSAHPPVIVSGTFAADDGTYPTGLLLARAADGSYAPYDPTGDAPLNAVVGVLDAEIDTSNSTVGLVVIHGSVIRTTLKVGATDSESPTESQLDALRDAGIFAE
ncbi:hypothetical protein [Desulfoplanes formicivorans]|uniref:Head decoration protein n=1 Tax=Desulfoplanes formicivorans TaxID=1592317 RepID=A0A194ADH8_9BACT|nr:hypothetical protein [Desulfoplanes formicivorans]GAU08137.1 hypothetical protein DPF_0840 [Desulfoplanes formicivorans]